MCVVVVFSATIDSERSRVVQLADEPLFLVVWPIEEKEKTYYTIFVLIHQSPCFSSYQPFGVFLQDLTIADDNGRKKGPLFMYSMYGNLVDVNKTQENCQHA